MPARRTKYCWCWTPIRAERARQAQQFHAGLGVTGLVLTKLDGTAKGGIVHRDRANQLKIPIRFIGVGEQAEDFGEFDAAPSPQRSSSKGAARGARNGREGGRLVIRFDRVSKRYANGREALARSASASHTARWCS
jgi:hypothetical protein